MLKRFGFELDVVDGRWSKEGLGSSIWSREEKGRERLIILGRAGG